ncbi:MAG: hypothetical protein JXK04_00930 [Campylobacterales bacterium]|nr:hypothetical protein [Campylobacterales bacterium]
MEHPKFLYIEHDRLRVYHNGAFHENGETKLWSGAIVPLSLLNIHTLKLPDHLSDEELAIQVEIRMFEEGNLSSDEEYTIDFIRHPMATESSVLVEAFALSHAKAQEYFGESLAKTGSIDRIVPGFMVYAALYPAIEARNDLFLYWGEEEAYAAIYQDGRYIAHRSIETLTTIAVETGLDLNKLKFFLHTKGLVEENYSSEELNKYILIQERIAKNIERVVHTINHKRGLFGLSGIDRCYLDFEGKAVPGLEDIFKAYGIPGLIPEPLTHESTPPDAIHDALCADYLSQNIPFNLSPYPRKAPWYARESGKFLGIVGGMLLSVLLAAFAVSWMLGSAQERNDALNEELASLRQETASLSATLKKNHAELKAHQAEAAARREEILLYKGAEETAVLIRDMHTARQQFLLDTTAELGRYRLGAMLMEQNGSKSMNVHVVADDRKRDDIAKLMSGLYARGYQDVQTHEITLDNDMYNSLVKVTR